MYNNIATRMRTNEVRLSYVHLVQPRVDPMNPNAQPKYSVTLLIPKSDTATKANIDATIEAAIAAATMKRWSGVRPPVVPIPIHDGDGQRENGTPFGPECRNCWVMTASTRSKPQVVHQSNIRTLLAPEDIYSGMYAMVMLDFYGYLTNGRRGISCQLGNIMKTRDGEPLGPGLTNAWDDFGDVGQALNQPEQSTQNLVQFEQGYPQTSPQGYPQGYPQTPPQSYSQGYPQTTPQVNLPF